MPPAEGYRVKRLREQRRRGIERWQVWLLALLALLVGFAAVLGAWYLGSGLIDEPRAARKRGFVTLMTIQPAPGAPPVAAALVVKDPRTGDHSLWTLPTELLLEGPNGEYVLASDALVDKTVREDLQRVIDSPIDTISLVPGDALAEFSGAEELALDLQRPVTLEVDGVEKGYPRDPVIPADAVASLFAAEGATGYDETIMQQGLWRALLQAAAERPPEERAAAARRVAQRSGGQTSQVAAALLGAARDQPAAERIPSSSRVAEGQFAFVPKPDEIMAEITRRSPAFAAPYTVLLRNGSGRVGVAEAAARRLAALDVNLPSPLNADTFDYRQTQILAGREALGVARDVRAILGRGVVLDGKGLPPTTVMVILGSDVTAQDLEAKDHQ